MSVTCPVLLIDEIDKAPRDFPNDLLLELDQHRFQHPFLNEVITPRVGTPPIVVITSNVEQRLPDAFLRRCIFHHIELTEQLVREAVRRAPGIFRTWMRRRATRHSGFSGKSAITSRSRNRHPRPKYWYG